nr:hypothetical protein Itr_chr01CG06840 [Ipomoea trifida]
MGSARCSSSARLQGRAATKQSVAVVPGSINVGGFWCRWLTAERRRGRGHGDAGSLDGEGGSFAAVDLCRFSPRTALEGEAPAAAIHQATSS